jgi:hypothetical protein
MAKFLPVIGEITTLFESGAKLVAAGATAPFNPEAGKKLLASSGDAWKSYSQENLVACAVRGDGAGIKRSADGFSKSCPVVAHARSGYHLVKGETKEAYECAANGTKALGVIGVTAGVTVATGGLGVVGACTLVGASAATSQVAFDAVDSGIRREAVGTVAGVKLACETGDAVHIADAIIAPAQTGVMAAGGAAIGRGLAARAAAAEQNLAGTGQNMAAPQARPNPTINAANLEALPPRPGSIPSSGPANPTPSGPSVAPSSISTSAASSGTGSGASMAMRSEYSVRDSCLSDVHDAPAVPAGSRVPIDAKLAPGKYKYVVQKDGSGGNIVRLQRFDISDRCHADCAGGVNAKVIHAGEVELVRQGGGLAVKRFNSCSGHFKPQPFDPATSIFQGTSEAFQRVVQPFRQHFDVPRSAEYWGMRELTG